MEIEKHDWEKSLVIASSAGQFGRVDYHIWRGLLDMVMSVCVDCHIWRGLLDMVMSVCIVILDFLRRDFCIITKDANCYAFQSMLLSSPALL
jgi:hypothetical protein